MPFSVVPTHHRFVDVPVSWDDVDASTGGPPEFGTPIIRGGDDGSRGPVADDHRGGIGSPHLAPQDTDGPQERLPFNTCAEFVDYLVAYATKALNLVVESQTVNNLPQVATTVGTGMMSTAYFGYETHIHNGYDGFKDELTSAGRGTAAGEQGAGVYGHIFFAGGAWIFAKGNPAGYAAYIANSGKDWLQAATGWFGGGSQYASERAGNIAARPVGLHMWNFISGTTPRDPQRLRNSLTKELCR